MGNESCCRTGKHQCGPTIHICEIQCNACLEECTHASMIALLGGKHRCAHPIAVLDIDQGLGLQEGPHAQIIPILTSHHQKLWVDSRVCGKNIVSFNGAIVALWAHMEFGERNTCSRPHKTRHRGHKAKQRRHNKRQSLRNTSQWCTYTCTSHLGAFSQKNMQATHKRRDAVRGAHGLVATNCSIRRQGDKMTRTRQVFKCLRGGRRAQFVRGTLIWPRAQTLSHEDMRAILRLASHVRMFPARGARTALRSKDEASSSGRANRGIQGNDMTIIHGIRISSSKMWRGLNGANRL